MEYLPKLVIICFANYCRSPVAEKIMSKMLKGRYSVSSRGIGLFSATSMDKRSISYLNSIGIENTLHLPTQIKSSEISESELILAMDMNILMELNKKFIPHQKKIKLFNLHCPAKLTNDPISMNSEGYSDVMKNIYDICYDLEKRL